MNKPAPLLHLKTLEALLIAIIIVAWMGFTIIQLHWVPQLSILSVIVLLIVYGAVRHIGFNELRDSMTRAVSAGMGAVYLFFFIGALISALMFSGSIPSLIFYSLSFIDPYYFYAVCFILNAIIGIAIGGSLTTCSTIGVAFMGMAGALHADLIITAGAIVSGSFFGDKMSPISDTTGIAASIVGIDLFEHIKNMSYTTVPAFIISLVIYGYLSSQSLSADSNSINVYQQLLQQSNLIHGYSLLPFAVMVILTLKKVSAIPTMMWTILSAIIITYIHTPLNLTQLGQYFFQGYQSKQDLGEISQLLQRGGLESMFFVQTIVILSLSLGGLLAALGITPALLHAIQGFLTTAGRATFCVAMTSVGVNILIGEQYLSILLSGETFKSVYQRLQLHPKNLARTLEDAGTVINPLVPWSVSGVFISQTLGVSVWHYLPYAFFCYLCLLLTLFFGFSGKTLTHVDDGHINT